MRKIVLDRDSKITNPGFGLRILHDVELLPNVPLPACDHELVIADDVEVDCDKFKLFANGMVIQRANR